MFLSFSIDDPKAVWDTAYVPLAQAIEESGIGRIAIASPFIPTIPGTDSYTDQL